MPKMKTAGRTSLWAKASDLCQNTVVIRVKGFRRTKCFKKPPFFDLR